MLSLVVVLQVFSGCTFSADARAHVEAGVNAQTLMHEMAAPEIDFSYMHLGQDWSQGECASRERQSPIDFGAQTAKLKAKETFYFEYEKIKTNFELLNNAHSLAANLAGKGIGGITLREQFFDFLSANFHVKSEHTFHGEHFPLELHLVHKEPDFNHVLVVAIPFTVPPTVASQFLQQKPYFVNPDVPLSMKPAAPAGPPQPNTGDMGFNPSLQNFLTYPLPKGASEKMVEMHTEQDFITPFIKGGEFFHYTGSLTAPPCTESVTWLVRKTPVMMSASQGELIKANILQATFGNGNSRSTMPLMGRLITLMSATEGAAPQPKPDGTSINKMKGQGADFGAVIQAKEAYKETVRVMQSGENLSGNLANSIIQHFDAARIPPPHLNPDFMVDVEESKRMPPADPNVQFRRMVAAVGEQVAQKMQGGKKADDGSVSIDEALPDKIEWTGALHYLPDS